MNKKLLAVAIAGVLAAPLAQAQTANVTLYGRLNLDAEVINAKRDTGVKQNIYRVSTNSSRFGIKGTESLGGGLNAIFQAESSLNADASGGTLAGRETYAGLQGGWGTAKIGYFLAPYDDIQAIFGSVPTLQTGILGSQGVWANGGASLENGGFDSRVGNSLRYDSPNISGFTGSVQLGARDVGGSGTLEQERRHAYIISTAGFYTNGPIQAGVAYEVHNKLREGITKLQDQALTVAGSYNFGVVKVGAAWERVEYDVGEIISGVPITGDLKRDFWAVSATGNLGPGQLYVAYFKANDGKGSSQCVTTGSVTRCPRIGAVTQGSNSGAQQWEISYTYPLSKRTLLYTGYTMIDNDANGAYNFGVNAISAVCQGNGAACGDAARPQGIVAGMVHFF